MLVRPSALAASKPRLSLVLRTNELLSLTCARESNQREAHPGCRARRAARAGFARTCRGSLNAHPCACNERARIVRAPLRAFRQTLAAANGDPRSQARSRARSRASKSERCISAVQVPCPCRRSNAKAQRRVLTLLRHLVTSRTHEALDLRSLRVAAAAAAMPVGAARGIAPIPLSAQGCAVSGTQVAVADFSG